MTRDWTVRDIEWCEGCADREVNGTGASLCAQCQGFLHTLEALWQSSSHRSEP